MKEVLQENRVRKDHVVNLETWACQENPVLGESPGNRDEKVKKVFQEWVAGLVIRDHPVLPELVACQELQVYPEDRVKTGLQVWQEIWVKKVKPDH